MDLLPGIAPTDLERLAEVASEVALACGRLIVDERPARVGVAATKSTETDVVTVMDRRSEELARSMLTRLRPDDAILGEEGADAPGTSGITWVVDPIDGTVNYLYDIDEYAVCVAAVVGDAHTPGAWTPIAGAVHQPCSGELYEAVAGGGARLNGAPLGCAPAASLGASLVGTGFGYEPAARARQGAIVAGLLPRVRDIRRHGVASLDIVAVARGRLDAYYEFGLHAWDYAAAWLIAAEAGAAVRGPEGGPPTDALVLAGRGDVLDELAAIVTA